jgi:hypothetical protein
MFTDYLQNIPEAKFTSLIVQHEMVTQPNDGGKSTTITLRVSDEHGLVKVPVFEA